jgi:hypothetical protein
MRGRVIQLHTFPPHVGGCYRTGLARLAAGASWSGYSGQADPFERPPVDVEQNLAQLNTFGRQPVVNPRGATVAEAPFDQPVVLKVFEPLGQQAVRHVRDRRRDLG